MEKATIKKSWRVHRGSIPLLGNHTIVLRCFVRAIKIDLRLYVTPYVTLIRTKIRRNSATTKNDVFQNDQMLCVVMALFHFSVAALLYLSVLSFIGPCRIPMDAAFLLATECHHLCLVETLGLTVLVGRTVDASCIRHSITYCAHSFSCTSRDDSLLLWNARFRLCHRFEYVWVFWSPVWFL